MCRPWIAPPVSPAVIQPCFGQYSGYEDSAPIGITPGSTAMLFHGLSGSDCPSLNETPVALM